MYMSRKLEYNKKGIPNFDELGTIPQFWLVPPQMVGTIFINMINITIISSIMMVQRYFSAFLIISPPPTQKVKENST